MNKYHKKILLSVLFVFLCVNFKVNAARPPDDGSGTFFQVEDNTYDLLYYLTDETPPRIKKVVFSSGNQPQTIISKGGSFDLSSDGQKLVYSYGGRLYLIRSDGHGEPTWTRGNGERARWSVNDNLIAFISPLDKGVAIMVMDHLGEDTSSLLRIDEVVDYFWEKNSEGLLAVVKRKNSFYIVRVFLDGRKDIIYQFPKTIEVKKSALSPDDTKLAYVSRNKKTGEETVFLVDLNIYRLFRLTRPYQECSGLSWSPDSKNLVFSANSSMYTVRGSKGNVFKLKSNASNPVWSRNSSRIAFTRANMPSAVSLYDINNDYIQDINLSAKTKTNLILVSQQKSLADIKVEMVKGENISYSLGKTTEREMVHEGMLIPLSSSVVTDSYTSANFVMGDDVRIQVSPLTEIKIRENTKEGHFDALNRQREISLRVLSGQVIINDNNEESVVMPGEEYVVILAKASTITQNKDESQIPASLLLGLAQNTESRGRQSSRAQSAKQAPESDQTVNHPHEAKDLDSDCLECHPSEPDWKKVDYQTVEFTTSAAAGCIKCHIDLGFAAEKVVANMHGFLDDPNRCLDCHREKPIAGVDNYRTVSFVDTLITLCTNCHTDDIGASHPVGMVPKVKKYVSNVKTPDTIRVMEIPPDLHLDEDGLMTCVTCHVVHGNWRDSQKAYKGSEPLGEIFGEKFYQTYFLRRNNYNSGLCAACHGSEEY